MAEATTVAHDVTGPAVKWVRVITRNGAYWVAQGPAGDVLATGPFINRNDPRGFFKHAVSWLAGLITGVGVANLPVAGIVRTGIATGAWAVGRAVGKASGGTGSFGRGVSWGGLASLAREGWQLAGDIDKALTVIRHGAISGIPATGLGSASFLPFRARMGFFY